MGRATLLKPICKDCMTRTTPWSEACRGKNTLPWNDVDEAAWEVRVVQCPNNDGDLNFTKARNLCVRGRAQRACVNGTVYPIEEQQDG